MRRRSGPPCVHGQHVETWTPDLVRDVLLDALRWQRRHGGKVGPGGFARVHGLAFVPTDADRAREGWGLAEVAGDADDVPTVHPLDAVSGERQALFRRALEWQLDHLQDHTADAAALAGWLAAKVDRQPLEAELARRGVKLARAHAYRIRDRALGRIASALEAAGEPLPGVTL